MGAAISVAEGNLMVLGKKVLSEVNHNVVVTPASGGALLNGAFLGVESDQKGSRRVFPIGKLEYVLAFFLSFFYFLIAVCFCFIINHLLLFKILFNGCF